MPSRKAELIGYSADSHGGYRVLMDATTGERAESTDVIFHEATEVPGGGMSVCLATKRAFIFPLKLRSDEPEALERLHQDVSSRGRIMRTLWHDKSGQ